MLHEEIEGRRWKTRALTVFTRGEDYEKLQTMSFVFLLACSLATGKTIIRHFMITRK